MHYSDSQMHSQNLAEVAQNRPIPTNVLVGRGELDHKRTALRVFEAFQGFISQGLHYDGRYWIRTSDPFRVKEVRYHCANRP